MMLGTADMMRVSAPGGCDPNVFRRLPNGWPRWNGVRFGRHYGRLIGGRQLVRANQQHSTGDTPPAGTDLPPPAAPPVSEPSWPLTFVAPSYARQATTDSRKAPARPEAPRREPPPAPPGDEDMACREAEAAGMRGDQPDLALDEQLAKAIQDDDGTVCRFDGQVQLSSFGPWFAVGAQ